MIADVVDQLAVALKDDDVGLNLHRARGPYYPEVSAGLFTLSDADTGNRFKVDSGRFTIDDADGSHVAWLPPIKGQTEPDAHRRFFLREEGDGVVLPDIIDGHIYDLDAPVNTQAVNLPALIITPVNTETDTQSSQGVWDSVHTVGFEFATDEPDENKWRQDATHWAEALMRFLDHFNANESDYVGSSRVITVEGWSVNYTVTWSSPPNAIRGFALEADIFARDRRDTHT